MAHSAGVNPAEGAAELQTLLRKLTDIGDEIERIRQHLEQLSSEFGCVNSAIRAVSGSARPEPAHEVQMPDARSVPSMVLRVLAATERSLSARDIAIEIMTLQALDIADAGRLKNMTHRVCVSLWVQNQKGLVRKIEQSRSRFRWEIRRA